MNKKVVISIVAVLFLFSCSSDPYKKWNETEVMFYNGQYNSAIDQVRELANDAGEKDKLLYLMEAGVIFHTMGEYKKSNIAFKEANDMAERIKTSLSKQALSFFLSDRKKNFKGENFERVLIKFYMALNHMMMNDYESAKRAFRKLDYDLKDMKYTDDRYKQNLAARYLDAIISESLGKYNDARVQYKNIIKIAGTQTGIYPDRYILAVKENDKRDMQRFKQGRKDVSAYTKDLQPTSYNKNMGELVIIHQAGRAPAKKSRGRILNDKGFMVALRAAIHVAIVAEGAAVSTSGVIAMMGTAENPIPKYEPRDIKGSKLIGVLLNNKHIGRTRVYNDYTTTAVKNYNDNYSGMITKNVASIATKVVLAAVAADKISDKVEESSGGGFFASKVSRFLIGAGTGKLVAETIAPDLRCWRLIPSNYQIKRVFLEPGEYDIKFDFTYNDVLVSKYPHRVVIKKGQPVFINLRSMSASYKPDYGDDDDDDDDDEA